MTWYIEQITSCLIEMYKFSHNYYFNYSSWEWFFFLPNILKEVPPRVFCGFAHLLTQKASSAEQLQAFYFLKVN